MYLAICCTVCNIDSHMWVWTTQRPQVWCTRLLFTIESAACNTHYCAGVCVCLLHALKPFPLPVCWNPPADVNTSFDLMYLFIFVYVVFVLFYFIIASCWKFIRLFCLKPLRRNRMRQIFIVRGSSHFIVKVATWSLV